MKLPADRLIARIKITHYLLVPQAKGDKSAFLAITGYDAASADQLIDDIRSQVLPCDALPLEVNERGHFYQISCSLAGPNGRTLSIRTIWMKEHLFGQTKLITLIPERSH